MPDGPWSFKYFPWLREMHDSKAEYNVAQKAAQMGVSEMALNVTFHAIDILVKNCMYVLPNKHPDASEFSASRFAPALELSKHLKEIFSDADNVGHKRAGAANLYIRGSKSRSGLKSAPVSRLILDEVAEFPEANIPLAFARTDGQRDRLIWLISTPTIDGHGISPYFEQSDKRHFFFKCPSCSRSVELKFPESLIITAEDVNDSAINNSHYICHACKATLPHELKYQWLAQGEWVKSNFDRDWAGFTIPQLYSSAKAGSPVAIAKFYLQSLYDVATRFEFYNSKLGMTFEDAGTRVREEHIDACVKNGYGNRNNDPPKNGLYTMGVDVGPQVLHCEIARWLIDPAKIIGGDVLTGAKPIVTQIVKVPRFEDLDKLMAYWGVVSCVIDCNPDRHSAGDFAKRHYGRVKLCGFNSSVHGKTLQESKVEVNNDPMIIVNRTAWLDQALGRIINGTISLPFDTDIEYREHVKEPAKLYKKDADGNPIARYITKEGKGDHYAFARCYNEIALVFAANMSRIQQI